MAETVTVILTPVDVERFKLFQKHYKIIEIMEEKNVFDLEFGKVVLNFAYGDLQNITKEEMIFRK